MKSITLRPAKCWSKDGTPKLKKGRCNALSGQGHRAPWSNGGIVISRGKPKERGQKPVYVVFRKHVIRDWITLQLYIFFWCTRVLFNDAYKCSNYTAPNYSTISEQLLGKVVDGSRPGQTRATGPLFDLTTIGWHFLSARLPYQRNPHPQRSCREKR